MAVEGDLVADLGFVAVYARIRSMGQHLAFEAGFTLSLRGTFSVSRRLRPCQKMAGATVVDQKKTRSSRVLAD
jgi:hypothetical protein